MITSLHNPRVKAAAKLRDGRQRQKQRRIIIDGARELLRALAAGVELIEVFVCEELCRSDECRIVLAALAEPVAHEAARIAGLPQPPARPGGESAMDIPSGRLNPGQSPGLRVTPGQSPGLRVASGVWPGGGVFATRPAVLRVSPAVFEKLAYGARAEGVVGVARMPSTSLAELPLPQNPLVAVLEGLEKPGNVGAVLRSADAAGVSALIVADGGTDLYNANAIRASLGTIFSVPVCAASSEETLAWLRVHELAIYAAWVDAELEYTQVDFTRPCAIVLGSEAAGLTNLWRHGGLSATGIVVGPSATGAASAALPLGEGRGEGAAITPIKLPMLGVADSLNVSTAAAVLFYEALRQRRGGSAG